MLYRPLVQPTFSQSRGQWIAPGTAVLATGGPKQRGQLRVENPSLFYDAQNWGSGTVSIIRANGHIRFENANTVASEIFTRQDLNRTVEIGNLYRVRIVLDEYEASGGEIRIAIGNTNILGPGGDIQAPNVYNFLYEVTSPPTSDDIKLYATDAVAMTAQFSFIGVYGLQGA